MTTEADRERAAVVAFLDRCLKESLVGKTRPEFICRTPAKAAGVIAHFTAHLSMLIERGDHLKGKSDE
ncbi:hypothetical protein ACMT1E_04465 [Sphingomonas flavalba]|uniref:hypothetical protein n=1 Tax=Sphingomonas flavalba TaxID=2559804 RepID=UPI0039DF5DA2